MKNRKFNSLLTKLISSIILLALTTVSLAFVTVGPTNDCDYNNLEAAYNDNDAIMRVTSQSTYSEVFIIEKTKFIFGGYDTCADAENNTLGTSKSKWRLGVNIEANLPALSIIFLDHFEIYDGSNNSFAGAGGIRVAGNSSLLLSNSNVHDNQSIEGGGIRVSGSAAKVTITNTTIENNTASENGAGVYCSDEAFFTMIGESAIENNSATFNGGGIYATDDCQISVLSGNTPNELTRYGILTNTAVRGGGVFMRNGADMELTGNDEHPATILGNASTLNDDFDVTVLLGGGGVYLTGDGTTFVGTNARIDSNIAKFHGAGFAVEYNAEFTMQRKDTPCWSNDKCSTLYRNNISENNGSGAVGYLFDHGTAHIYNTYISENKADVSSLFVAYVSSFLYLEGNLIVNNTSTNQASASHLIEMKRANLQSQVNFHYNTLTANNAWSIFHIDNTLGKQQLFTYNSIIWEQGDIIEQVGGSSNIVRFVCNLVHETTSLSVASILQYTYIINPNFVDAINFDYQLANNSQAKDMCQDTSVASGNDLNGNYRGYDDVNLDDLQGPFDAGAYEQNLDLIFANGFE